MRETTRDTEREPPDQLRSPSDTGERDSWQGLSPAYVRAAAADRMKALGHPDRLRIVEVLARGPKNVTELAAEVGRPLGTVSRNLRALHDANVVECSRSGNFVLYVLADRDVARLAAVAYRGASQQTRRAMSLVTPRGAP
jgi:DNA-binding transcriptional ArsR family regulator